MKDKILQLRREGLTIRAIQKELGLSTPSLVHYYLHHKSKKVTKPVKYCYECGSMLKAEVSSTTYDTNTGEPMHKFKFKCPKSKWHTIEEPEVDYSSL